MASTHLSDERVIAVVREHGSVRAAAVALGVPRTTLGERYRRLAPAQMQAMPAAADVTPRRPKLTRSALHQALRPPNNCRVKVFADSLDPQSRGVLEEALAYDRRDLSASRLRQIMLDAGFAEADVPGVDAINAHRAGARPCRCKG